MSHQNMITNHNSFIIYIVKCVNSLILQQFSLTTSEAYPRQYIAPFSWDSHAIHVVIAKYYAKQVIMVGPRDLEVINPSRVAVKGWPAGRLELKALRGIYFGAFKGKLTRQRIVW